ncbi:MAG: phage integrase [Candidatus Brocadia sinica]|nr:MAG: phage integrase [Candidatus Brocadia sinica]
MFIGDRERGKLNLPKKKVIPTLAEYSKTYLELYKGAKENTLGARKRAVSVLVEYLGSYHLDKITAFVIEKFRIERKEKDQVKDGTINDDVSALNHIFGKAIKEGILDKNPCKDIKKLKVAQSRDRVLSAEEIALLLNKLESKGRFMVLVGLFTGMRLGEVLRLKWADIDFARGLIMFVQSKTNKQVTVPLSSYLADELTKYKEGHTEERLFESKEITNAVVIRYSEYFSGLFKELGIDNFTFHNLRHSFASLQGDIGTGAIVTQNMLGHSKST